MKSRLTLQEKLRDLREERKLKLAELSEATGIPISTLQRFESDEDIRGGYQDVAALAKFYDVSADYLFGLTDNRQYRNIEIDKLRLSDKVVEILKDGNLNNRLISEFLSHEDFPHLLNSMEVYIDRKVLPQMNTMNAMYKLAENTIKENFDVSDKDETMKFLQELVVDEDEYLRYRISERFNIVIKKLFDAHKKDALPNEQNDIIKEMKSDMDTYLENRENETQAKSQMIFWAKKLGFNISKLTDEEQRVFIKVLEQTNQYKNNKRRK